MSRTSDLANEIRSVVSDAIPDPPRHSPCTISADHTDRNNPHFNNNSQDDRTNDDASAAVNSAKADNDDDDVDDSRQASSTSTSKENSPRISANKPKRASKSKKTASVSYNIINSQDISIGPKIKYVYNLNNNNIHNNKASSVNHDDKFDADTAATTTTDPKMPAHVEALSTSRLEITKEDMLQVKTHMGRGWKQVAKCIGYSKGQIEQFSDNYKRIDETVYQLLLDWKQSCTNSATVGRLITAMWSSEEYDCAEILAAAHTTNDNCDES